MPPLTSVEDFAKAVRELDPEGTAGVSDDELTMKIIGRAPKLAPLVDIKPLHERTRKKSEELSTQAGRLFPGAPSTTPWRLGKEFAGGVWGLAKSVPGIVAGLSAEPSEEERQRWVAPAGQPIPGGAAAQRLFEMPGKAALEILKPEGGPSVPLAERLGKTFLGEEVTEQAKTDLLGAMARGLGQAAPFELLRLAEPAAKLTARAGRATSKAIGTTTRIIPLEKSRAFETLQESLTPGEKVPGPVAATKESAAEIATAARASKIDVSKEGWTGLKKAAKKAADNTWVHIETRLAPYWNHPSILLDKAKLPELGGALNSVWTKAFQNSLPTEAAEFQKIASKVLDNKPITFREAQILLDPLDKKLLSFYEENPILRRAPELDPATSGVLRTRNFVRETFSTEADKLVTEGGMGDALRTWGNIKDVIGDATVQERITEHWKALPWSARRSMNIAQAYHATSAVTGLSPRHAAVAAALGAAKRTPGANELLMKRAFRAIKDEPSGLMPFGAHAMPAGPTGATVTGPLFSGPPTGQGGFTFGPGGIGQTQPPAGLLHPGQPPPTPLTPPSVPPTALPSGAPAGIAAPAGAPPPPPSAVSAAPAVWVSPPGVSTQPTTAPSVPLSPPTPSEIAGVLAEKAPVHEVGPLPSPAPKTTDIALRESADALGARAANARAKLVSNMSDASLKNLLERAKSEDLRSELRAEMSRRVQQQSTAPSIGGESEREVKRVEAALRERAEPTPRPAPAPAPLRTFRIGRGAHGQVSVEFPSENAANLYAFWGRFRKLLKGESGGERASTAGREQLAKRLGVTPGDLGALSKAYRDQVNESIKGLEEDSKFVAPEPRISPGASPLAIAPASTPTPAPATELTLDSDSARMYGKTFAELKGKPKDAVIQAAFMRRSLQPLVDPAEIEKRVSQSYPSKISDKARTSALKRAEKATAKRELGGQPTKISLEGAGGEAGPISTRKLAPSAEDAVIQDEAQELLDKLEKGEITADQAAKAWLGLGKGSKKLGVILAGLVSARAGQGLAQSGRR